MGFFFCDDDGKRPTRAAGNKPQSGDRPCRARNEPLHHDELIPADPEVVHIFAQLENARRRRELTRERRAWSRLAAYLSTG